jgi:hypothetical protein
MAESGAEGQKKDLDTLWCLSFLDLPPGMIELDCTACDVIKITGILMITIVTWVFL